MTRQYRIVTAAVILAGLLLVPFLTLQFIPNHVLEQSVQRLLASQGVTMQASRFSRSFPVGVLAEDVTFGNTAGTNVFKAKRLRLRLQLLPLLLGRVSCFLQADLGSKGKLSGVLTIKPQPSGTIQVNDLDLGDLPLLTTALGSGIHGTTRLDLAITTAQKTGTTGNIRFAIADLQLAGVKIGGMPLPDASFPEVRGQIKLTDQTATIENLALQGNGIYLRLSGNAPLNSTTPLNLSLELFPSPELLTSQQSLFLLMLPYQISPGSYKLPITGTVANPQLLKR